MSAGNPPRALTGREAQKQQFRTMLGRLAREMNEPSMIVFGLRGVGKTVLLLEFESIADASGWTAPDPIEIRSDTDFRAELADAAYQALLRLDRRRALGGRPGVIVLDHDGNPPVAAVAGISLVVLVGRRVILPHATHRRR